MDAMTPQRAQHLAESAVNALTAGDWQPVAGTVNVGMSEDGSYWVADNGEEVNGLSREQAIAEIVSDLTA